MWTPCYKILCDILWEIKAPGHAAVWFSFNKSFSTNRSLEATEPHHRQAWRIDHTHGAPTAHTAHRTLPFLCTILAHRGNEINWGNLHVRHKTNNTCVIIIMFSACVVNHARTSNHHLHATSRRLSARQDDFPQVPVWSPVVHTHTHYSTICASVRCSFELYIYIYIVSSHLNYNY